MPGDLREETDINRGLLKVRASFLFSGSPLPLLHANKIT